MTLAAIVAMAAVFLLLFAGTSTAQQKALVVFNVGGNGITGTVTFEERAADCTVAVFGSISGLRPSAAHGLHVHAYGDVSNGCDSIGGHWNPLNATHGDLDADPSHAGDLGNVHTDDSGVVHVNLTSRSIARVGFTSLFGRSLAIHNGTDDLGLGNASSSHLSGNSGARLACGVIGVAIGSGGGGTIAAAPTSCGGTASALATTATASPQATDAPATASSSAASVTVTSRLTEADSASQSSSGNSTSAFGSSYAASAMTNTSSSYGGSPASTPAASQPSMAASISSSSSASPSNAARRDGITNLMSSLSIALSVAYWMSKFIFGAYLKNV